MNEALLHGKSGIKGIVGLEVNGPNTELFVQDENGNVTSVIKPHKYWLLASDKVNSKWAPLKGDLHYKWGWQTTDESEWQKTRNINKWKHDIWSIYNSREAAMTKDGYTFYRDLKHKDISVLSFDMETTGLDGNASDAKILLISITHRNSNGKLYNMLLSYDQFENEALMIKQFCNVVSAINPSIIMGHNCIPFDFPYLQARAKANKVKLEMGRDNSEITFNSYESKLRIDGTRNLPYHNVHIYGREIVDTYFLSINFDVSKSIETYALKPMIKQLGLEKEGRQFYDGSQIRFNYKDPVEWYKIKQYAVDDAEDPIKIWDMMGPLYFDMAGYIPKPFSDIIIGASGSKINAMLVRGYLQEFHSLPKADEAQPYEGAISFACPGIYSNCFKIDLEALYPNIMLEYNVYDEDKDPKRYLLELVETFKADRLKYKRLAAETGDELWIQKDTTAKSILNSFYGLLGAKGLLFNSPTCAGFITEKGREILLFTLEWASGKSKEEIQTMIGKDEEELEDEAV